MQIDLIPSHITQLIAEQLGVEIAAVTPEKNLSADLGADSLDNVELVMALEDAFDLEIPDLEAEKILTVQDAIDAVIRLHVDVPSSLGKQ